MLGILEENVDCFHVKPMGEEEEGHRSVQTQDPGSPQLPDTEVL